MLSNLDGTAPSINTPPPHPQTALEMSIHLSERPNIKPSLKQLSNSYFRPPTDVISHCERILGRLGGWKVVSSHFMSSAPPETAVDSLTRVQHSHHRLFLKTASALTSASQQMLLEEGLGQQVPSADLPTGSLKSQIPTVQLLGHFPSENELAPIQFHHLRPEDVDEKGSSDAARLLLSEWEIGRSAFNFDFRNPFSPSLVSENVDLKESAAPSSFGMQPTSFSQPNPQHPSNVRGSRKSNRRVTFQGLLATESQPEQFASSQVTDEELSTPQVFSQIVPGQFASRPRTVTSSSHAKKKMKRKTGF